MEPTSPATALLLPTTMSSLSPKFRPAYRGIAATVFEEKRRLLLHSPVAVGVVHTRCLSSVLVDLAALNPLGRPEESERSCRLHRSPLRNLVPRSKPTRVHRSNASKSNGLPSWPLAMINIPAATNRLRPVLRRQDSFRMLRLRLLGRSAKPGSAKLRSANARTPSKRHTSKRATSAA
jgi:hypothetical protein